MNETAPHIDERMARVLAGEASAEEQRELLRWREESPANEELFRKAEEAYLRTFAHGGGEVFHADRAWEKVASRMASGGGGRAIPVRTMPFTRWMRYAAIFAVCLAGAWWLSSRGGETVVAEIRAVEVPVRDTLAGFAIADLDRHGSIRHTSKGRLHRVELTGRAYFDVNRPADARFEVVVRGLVIEDVGTGFLVDGRRPDSLFVAVDTGVVRLSSPSGKHLILSAGQAGWYIPSKDTLGRSEHSGMHGATFTARDLRFRNDPLRRVVRRLSDAYPHPVVLAHETIGNCRISVRFEDQDQQTVVEVIAETLGLSWTFENDRYVLDGRGCPE